MISVETSCESDIQSIMGTSNLAHAILRRSGSRPALLDLASGAAITYDDLARETDLLARRLSAAGIGDGHVVMLVLPNGPQFILIFLALLSCGAAALPVNPAHARDELVFAMEDSHTSLVISTGEYDSPFEAAECAAVPVWKVPGRWLATAEIEGYPNACQRQFQPRAANVGGVALMLYTSGTTSRPKGVPLTHANLLASVANFADCFGLCPEDSTLVCMPLFHVHGLIGATLATLYSGGKAVIAPRFSAGRFWRDVTAHGVTWYSASPTVHRILVQRAGEEEAPRAVLRFIRSSSAKLGAALTQQMEDRFETVVLEAYGMTEAANQVTCNPLPPAKRKPGTVGVGTGVAVAIMDSHGGLLPPCTAGEVVIRGASVMHGYHNNATATLAAFRDGWFRTGDIGHLDEEGYLTVDGRIKDLIIRGGENISPAEVDAVLLEHPAVADAVCFGVPDEKYGEEIHAAVILRNAADEKGLKDFVSARLATFKVPKVIHITDSLPRTATNKVQRHLIAARFGGGRQA